MKNSNSPFYQKVAVITGAASGIGRALAIALSKHNCHLALADVNQAGLEETHSLINDADQTTRLYQVDVSDKAAFYTFSKQVIADFGKVQIVINNAGVAYSAPLRHARYDDFEWIMGINFWGVVYGSKAFLDHLLEQDESWLVNLSSIFGIIAVPTQGTYNVTKFAVRAFTEALRQEVYGSSLTVSCVHPGGIKTNIARSGRYQADLISESEKQRLIQDFDKIAKTSPEKAAAVILKGMRRKKRRILIGMDAKILDFFARLFPSRYDWLLRKLGGKAIADLEKNTEIDSLV